MTARPGSGWPGDPATSDTPVAAAPEDVARLATSAADLSELDARTSVCRACPRLVEWREQVAAAKRRSFADQPYWGRPVPGFGADEPRLLIVGLAPAAHGANRTGRMFTGDRSGDWLYAALYRAGVASQPSSSDAADRLRLRGTRITAPVHCAPPSNKPSPAERDTCRPWLARELQIVWPSLRSVLVLGAFGWDAFFRTATAAGVQMSHKMAFAHGAEAEVDGRAVIGCYHVSQQNTFTDRLTEAMLDAVVVRAVTVAGLAAQ